MAARKPIQAALTAKGTTRATLGATYGYARVSTVDQDLGIQRAALTAAGCEIVREEKASGTKRARRTELQTLLDFLRPGDTLVVTRIDRLARSVKDLQDVVHELRAKGATLKATEQPIDTGTAAGKAFLDMLGVFAEFETNLRRERQLEGIAAAKDRGVYKGGKPRIDAAEVRRLVGEGVGVSEVARRLGITRTSVYRLLGSGERERHERQPGPQTAARDRRTGLMPTNLRSSHKPRVHCPVDDIMRLNATGIRRAEIAERLDISQSSVDRIVIRERRRAGLAPSARRIPDRP